MLILETYIADKRNAYTDSRLWYIKAWFCILFGSAYSFGTFNYLAFSKSLIYPRSKEQRYYHWLYWFWLSGCGAWPWPFTIYWETSSYSNRCVLREKYVTWLELKFNSFCFLSFLPISLSSLMKLGNNWSTFDLKFSLSYLNVNWGEPYIPFILCVCVCVGFG